MNLPIARARVVKDSLNRKIIYILSAYYKTHKILNQVIEHTKPLLYIPLVM